MDPQPSTSQPADSCNVFVKFLPQSVDDSKLQSMFATFGQIASAKVMVNQQTGASLGYGFVRFANHEQAANAIRAMNGYKMEKKTLLCKYSNAQPAPKGQTPSNNLYVKPLLPSTTEDQLRALFSQFGSIKQVKVMVDKNTGRSRQIGFVMFENQSDAEAALQRMNGHKLDVSLPPLTVKFAESETEKAMRKQRQRSRQRFSPSQTMPVPPGMFSPFPGHNAYPPFPVYDPYSTPMYSMVPGVSSYPPFQPSLPLPPNGDAGANLFVFHLPSDVDDAALYRLFAPFGSLESVTVITDKFTGDSKGYGFVKYSRVEDALQAISHMNGFQVGNKRLKVSFKTKKSGRADLSPTHPSPNRGMPSGSNQTNGSDPRRIFGGADPSLIHDQSNNSTGNEGESRLVKLRINRNEERIVKVPFPSSTTGNNEGA